MPRLVSVSHTAGVLCDVLCCVVVQVIRLQLTLSMFKPCPSVNHTNTKFVTFAFIQLTCDLVSRPNCDIARLHAIRTVTADAPITVGLVLKTVEDSLQDPQAQAAAVAILHKLLMTTTAAAAPDIIQQIAHAMIYIWLPQYLIILLSEEMPRWLSGTAGCAHKVFLLGWVLLSGDN